MLNTSFKIRGAVNVIVNLEWSSKINYNDDISLFIKFYSANHWSLFIYIQWTNEPNLWYGFLMHAFEGRCEILYFRITSINQKWFQLRISIWIYFSYLSQFAFWCEVNEFQCYLEYYNLYECCLERIKTIYSMNAGVLCFFLVVGTLFNFIKP